MPGRFRPLVPGLAHVGRNLPREQQVGGVGLKQRAHVSILLVQPLVIRTHRQDHRHPVVDLGGQLVGVRGQGGEGFFIPEAAEGGRRIRGLKGGGTIPFPLHRRDGVN
jgi:hypothetical protein